MSASKSTVLVDATQLRDLHSGVARRLFGLWAAVRTLEPDRRVGFAAYESVSADLAAAFPDCRVIEVPDSGAGAFNRVRKLNPYLRVLRSQQEWDWIHQDGLLPCDSRTILTVHDLRVLEKEHATLFRRLYARTVVFPRLWTLKAPLVAPSSYVRNDLISRAGIKPEQVVVVPNAVDATRFAGGSSWPDLDGLRVGESFRLFVGHLEARKNIPFLLEIHRALAAAGHPAKLVVAAHERPGGEEWRASLESEPDVIVVDGPDDAVLGTLYRAASVFLLPSTLEGFSIAPIEALVLGTLPVVSDIPAHREGVGQAFCVPLNTEDWVKRVIDAESAPPTESAGAGAAEKWSWSKSAAAMVDLLHTLED